MRVPTKDPEFYKEGAFAWGDFRVIVTIDDGKWHLSIRHPSRDITYAELKRARYRFLPPDINAAMIFPPPEEFVNLSEFCFHLWQIDRDPLEDMAITGQRAAEELKKIQTLPRVRVPE